MDLGLRDRVYLVTGGSRGLGFAGAEALLGEGARVVLSAPRENTIVVPVRIATDRVRELDALRGDPDQVRARESERGG